MVPSSVATSTTRPFQQPNHIEMFPASSAPSMIPFTTGAYGFSLAQYQVPQDYNIGYSSAVQPAAAYHTAPTELPSTTPHGREARNTVPSINRRPYIKTEAQSPVQQNRVLSEEGEGQMDSQADSTTYFFTDVDCLVKAIQAKQKNPQPASPKEMSTFVEPQTHASSVQPSTVKRKRYQCSIPGCNKSFYQKTYLEIHTRAHTGVKPFVCKEPSCGQRFSQLGNLKVRLSAMTVLVDANSQQRHTSVVTAESDRTTAISAARPLRSEGT